MYSLYFITLQRSGTRPVTKPLRSIRPEHRGTFHTQFWLVTIYIWYYICSELHCWLTSIYLFALSWTFVLTDGFFRCCNMLLTWWCVWVCLADLFGIHTNSWSPAWLHVHHHWLIDWNSEGLEKGTLKIYREKHRITLNQCMGPWINWCLMNPGRPQPPTARTK